jgi:hypothetical protein
MVIQMYEKNVNKIYFYPHIVNKVWPRAKTNPGPVRKPTN